MSVPSYQLEYSFQEASRSYVSALTSFTAFDAMLVDLMRAVCSQLYVFQPTLDQSGKDLLTSLSGLTEQQLGEFSSQSVMESYLPADDFITSLINHINIIQLGYFDGFEWTHIHFLQHLRSDPAFLAAASTARFYEYMANVANPFLSSQRCVDADSILTSIYGEYDSLLYSTFDSLVQYIHTFAEWDSFCSSLIAAVDSVDINDSSLGPNLLQVRCFIITSPTSAKLSYSL